MNKRGDAQSTYESGLAIWELMVLVIVAIFIVSITAIVVHLDDDYEKLVIRSVLERVEYCVENHVGNQKELDVCFGGVEDRTNYIKIGDKIIYRNLGIKTEIIKTKVTAYVCGKWRVIDVEIG